MDDLDQIILKGGDPCSSMKLNIGKGTLTRDPNLRYLSNGTASCDFALQNQQVMDHRVYRRGHLHISLMALKDKARQLLFNN